MTAQPSDRRRHALRHGPLALSAIPLLGVLFASILAGVAFGRPAPFQFASIRNVGEMQSYIQQNLPVGSDRDQARKLFVSEGGATLKLHPTKAGVEKYIYDIDICSRYVWRWNISADYTPEGRLVQMYLNGETVLQNGPPLVFPDHSKSTATATISKAARPRPQASKGDDKLYYLVVKWDVRSPSDIDDDIIGGGPTQADPTNMGTLHVYHANLWRSIFDSDEAKTIATYSGKCPALAAGGRPSNFSLSVVTRILQMSGHADAVQPH